MTEILNFPTKIDKREHTPEGALEYILDAINTGKTNAKTMVISWIEEDETSFNHRFMVAGEPSFSSVITLLEVTKHEMISNQ